MDGGDEVGEDDRAGHRKLCCKSIGFHDAREGGRTERLSSAIYGNPGERRFEVSDLQANKLWGSGSEISVSGSARIAHFNSKHYKVILKGSAYSRP